MAIHDGGCLCGKLRFRVTAPMLESGYCHCRMCQKNSGAPVVAWVTFPAASFSWIGEPGTYAAKAAVLPVPVCAWPRRSSPRSSTGMVAAWIGVGDS
jgi:hypothetical protein